jgi:4-hydroxybenzoate polyprenyltransferase
MAEVIVITLAGVVGLGGFGAGLVAQDPVSALEGLALFFATYFYTLIRAYQLKDVD